MKKYLNFFIAITMAFTIMTTTVHAASYDSVKRQFGGYGVSTSTESDQNIGKEFTVGELVNRGKTAVKVTDKFTAKKGITFSSTCASSISASVGVTDGVASTTLGAKISNSYSFESNFVYSYTKSITKKVPAKSKYTIKVQAKGDALKVYYKYFVAWITTSKGQGTIYIPKYYSFIAN